MIEASFNDLSKNEVKNAISDKNNQKGVNKLLYPSWNFENKVKRLDYDEINNVVTLHLTNFQVI